MAGVWIAYSDSSSYKYNQEESSTFLTMSMSIICALVVRLQPAAMKNGQMASMAEAKSTAVLETVIWLLL